MIEAAENPGSRDIGRIMEEAQAEIDFLPDNQIGLLQMHDFGYRNDSVLPLTVERAAALHNAGLPIYSLHEDGSSTLMNTEQDILETGGIFGVDARAWESHLVMESVHKEKEEREMDEEYQEVEVFEVPALFSNGRIAEGDVPKGFYRYDLRGLAMIPEIRPCWRIT